MGTGNNFIDRGFDDHEPLLPVNARYVTPGEGDKVMLGEQQIGLKNLLFQSFQHTYCLNASTAALSMVRPFL